MTIKVEWDMSEPQGLAVSMKRGFDPTAPAKLSRHYGTVLLARTRQKASGRPGPNVITGRYRASIQLRYTATRDGNTVEVFSDAPQARRLEFGFRGTDSLGRSYNQPPFPHFGPALDETAKEYEAGVEEASLAWLDRALIVARGR